jgi:hypothetical protein
MSFNVMTGSTALRAAWNIAIASVRNFANSIPSKYN